MSNSKTTDDLLDRWRQEAADAISDGYHEHPERIIILVDEIKYFMSEIALLKQALNEHDDSAIK